MRRRTGLGEIQHAHIWLPRAPALVLGERHGVTGADALTVVPEVAGGLARGSADTAVDAQAPQSALRVGPPGTSVTAQALRRV